VARCQYSATSLSARAIRSSLSGRIAVRTLDAVHIATVESLGEPPQLMAIGTRDHRVRENVKALGYSVE
jgi:hypothetical protein